MRILFSLLTALLFISCSPKIKSTVNRPTLTAIEVEKPIHVLKPIDALPEKEYGVGRVYVNARSAEHNVSYEEIIKLGQQEARKMGANVLKIEKHYRPDLNKPGHRIYATAYYIEDFKPEEYRIEEPIYEDWDHALIFVYRPHGYGYAIGYNLFLDDEKVMRVKNRSASVIKVKDFGEHTLWAKTEKRKEVKINIEKGKTYYLRCGVGMGILVGVPTMELVEWSDGKYEYDKLNQEK